MVILWGYLWTSLFIAAIALAFGTTLAISDLNTRYYVGEITADWGPLLSIALILGLANGLYLRPFRGAWFSWAVCFFIMIVVGFFGYLVPLGRLEVPDLIWKVGPFLFPGVFFATNLWVLRKLHRNDGPYAVVLTLPKTIFLVALFFVILGLFWARFDILWSMGDFATPPSSLQLANQGKSIAASPLTVPAHILPEWYFRPFYAILRLPLSETTGIALVSAVVLTMFVFPWLCKGEAGPFYRSPRLRWIIPLALGTTFWLGWLASVPSQGMFVPLASSVTVLWVTTFLVGLPWANRTAGLPKSDS